MDVRVTTLLFDLGGVLIELDGSPLKDHWLETPVSYADAWLRWGQSPVVKAFETGIMPADEFVERIIAEQGLLISSDQFKQEFTRWPKGLFAGARELLLSLRKDYTLGFYSNTNELHLPWLTKDLGLESLFDYCFASYEIGYFKPDTQGFAYAADKMGVDPRNILFIDDNMLNVEGARKAGLHAEKAFELEEVKAVLHKYGCTG